MILFILTAIAVSSILHLTLGLALKHQFERNVLPHIIEYQRYIRNEIGVPPDLERAAALTKRIPVDIYISGPRVRWNSTSRPLKLDEIKFHPWRNRRFQKGEDGDRIFLRSRIGRHLIVLAFQRKVPQQPDRKLLLFAFLSVIGVLLLSWLAMRRLIKPVATIQQGINRIGKGELSYRIQVDRKDELGELASSINNMADDIEGMLDAKRELLLAMSHELRSPLTRSRVSLELLEDSPFKDNILDDLNEMEQLITELLESERLNQRHTALQKSTINPDSLIETVISKHFKNNEIDTQLNAGDISALLDEVRISLLLKNLLTNALRYNAIDGPNVILRSWHDDSRLFIEIEDHGEGIDEIHLPYLAEPFYRADSSRQRKTGGYGLGLYLCRMIAEAHGGKLVIRSKIGRGTTVSTEIPYRNKG
jgi:signal transduction histidine kinase